MTALSLHPESLRVGQVVEGTAVAHHGPVVHIDTWGPCDCYRALTFADRVEALVDPYTVWPVRGAA